MGIDRRAIEEMFATSTLGSPDNAIGFVLWRLVHRYQREIDRALAPVGLTHLQFTTLALAAWIEREDREATQAELARFGEIHPMQVSHMLKVLEHKGLIARAPSAANARAKRIGVTPAGLAALYEAMPIAIDVQMRIFGSEGRPGGKLLEALAGLSG